jgi:hypothetical protein
MEASPHGEREKTNNPALDLANHSNWDCIMQCLSEESSRTCCSTPFQLASPKSVPRSSALVAAVGAGACGPKLPKSTQDELVWVLQPSQYAYIRQQNQLVEARYSLTVRELKLVLYVCAMVDPTADTFGKCQQYFFLVSSRAIP